MNDMEVCSKKLFTVHTSTSLCMENLRTISSHPFHRDYTNVLNIMAWIDSRNKLQN